MNQLTNDEKFSPRVQGGKLLPNLRTLIDGSFYVHENKDVKDVYSYFGGAFIKLNLTKYDTLEVDTIIAHNLYAKRFTLRQTSFQNGDLMIGNAGGIVEAVNGDEITFKDQSGFNISAFAVGDLIEAYSVRADNSLEITHPQGTVTKVVGNKVTVTYYGTSRAFQKGDEVYSVGNTTDSTRRDSLYLSTNRPNTPYLAIYDNINSFDTVGSAATAWGSATPKVLIGNGKSLNSAYTYGVYIGPGGEFRISPSAAVEGVVTHAPVYTSGATFPASPMATDWHFYTKDPPDAPYVKNTWYKFNGTTWENQGLLGTYINGSGIYTGTIVANQIIAGTLTGFTIQTATTSPRIVMNTSSLVIYGDASDLNTLTISYSSGKPYINFTETGINYGSLSTGIYAVGGGAANTMIGSSGGFGISGKLSANAAYIATSIDINGSLAATQSWVGSNYAAASHTHAASAITSGTFADAYIASAAAWNAKENALSFSLPLVRSINAISIQQATGGASGFLSSSDWNTFNGKSVVSVGSGATYGFIAATSGGATTLQVSKRTITINGTPVDVLVP